MNKQELKTIQHCTEDAITAYLLGMAERKDSNHVDACVDCYARVERARIQMEELRFAAEKLTSRSEHFWIRQRATILARTEQTRPGYGWRWLWAPAEIARDTTRPDRLRLIVKEIPSLEQEDFRQMVRLLFQKEKLEVSLYPQLRYDYLLKVWLSLHIPLTAGLMIFSLIHIVSILYY